MGPDTTAVALCLPGRPQFRLYTTRSTQQLLVRPCRRAPSREVIINLGRKGEPSLAPGGLERLPSFSNGQGSESASLPLPHSNVFIKPVPAGWDEARLHQLFASFGDVDSVRISPEAPGRPGSSHAFVRYKQNDGAAAAIAGLQGSVLDSQPVMVKLADSDVTPRVQSGQCASEWCYCRGLPPHMNREEVLALFTPYGVVMDLKHFPSTEYYRGSGALVQMETVEHSSAVIQALSGCMLPGASQPLLVRFADSPAEKAAKAARKERQPMRLGSLTGATSLQEQLQRQLLELSMQSGGPPGFVPGVAGLSSAASLPVGELGMVESAFAPWSGSALASAPAARAHAGQGCSIYIKGMPEDADKLWLYEKFARFGGIFSVRVLVDEHTGKCNGIGFVNFTDPEGSRAGHETMNGVGMGDRLLHVMIQNANTGGSGRSSRQLSMAMQPSMERAQSYGGHSAAGGFGNGW